MAARRDYDFSELHNTAHRLLEECNTREMMGCRETYQRCVAGVVGGNGLHQVCECYATLGNCVHNAGCLNGTDANLNDQYCESANYNCCMDHGEFLGCGEQPFSSLSLCQCEPGFSGPMCNVTTAGSCSRGSSCTVCDKCCKDYHPETCEACVVDECDEVAHCSADSSCTVCEPCCRSYLTSRQMDCNICVADECPHLLTQLEWRL